MQVAAGSVCPDGHGKVMGKMPFRIVKRNHATISLGLKDITKFPGGGIKIPGDERNFKKVRLINRILNSWPSDVPKDHALAFDGINIVELEEIDSSPGKDR